MIRVHTLNVTIYSVKILMKMLVKSEDVNNLMNFSNSM